MKLRLPVMSRVVMVGAPTSVSMPGAPLPLFPKSVRKNPPLLMVIGSAFTAGTAAMQNSKAPRARLVLMNKRISEFLNRRR